MKHRKHKEPSMFDGRRLDRIDAHIAHLHNHILNIQRDLGELSRKLAPLANLESIMSAMSDAVDKLVTTVADENTVVDSMLTLADNLSAIIADLKAQADPATLQKLTDLDTAITAKKSAIAASVLKNTPAAATEPAPPA